MEKPARRSLLPGVSDSEPKPDVVFRSGNVVVSARRRAAIRDAFDLLLLAGVDGLFLRWPHAHIPALNRAETLAIVAGMNVVFVAYALFMRALPRWRARRLASTWSATERNRFVRF